MRLVILAIPAALFFAVPTAPDMAAALNVPGPPYFADQFTVMKNGNPFFDDGFTDGVPPPSAPDFANGTPASYFVRGTVQEAGGKVRLDRAGAAIVPGVGVPIPFFLEGARLNTNIDPNDLVLGLKNDDTFSMTGIFDLAVPSQNREFYGVRFTDATGVPNTANDLLHLGVRRGADGVDRVQFFLLDDSTSTFTAFAGQALDPNHDQIRVTLERLDVNSDAITATFAYIDGGVEGAPVTFGPTADIFHGENWTRAEFLFFTPVPGPGSMLLLATGLLGAVLAPSVRRRFKG
jgi:hypothetical protein